MKQLFVALSAMLLAACATLPPAEQAARNESRWQTHLSEVQKLSHWRASGRIAVKTADDGGNIRLVWSHTPEGYKLRLSAPFGRGVLQIDRDSRGVELHAPDGEVYRGQDADTLLYQHLGWQIPIEQLRQWLTGQPGNAGDFSIDERGLLQRASWQGWVAEFQRYSDEVSPTLPDQITVQRGQVRIRIVVDSWHQRQQALATQRVQIPGETVE